MPSFARFENVNPHIAQYFAFFIVRLHYLTRYIASAILPYGFVFQEGRHGYRAALYR